MSYQLVDDQMHCHRKIVKAGNEATGAWMRIGNWCSAHLTDGMIDHEVALLFAKREAVLDRLVNVGLLERDGADFRVHDYLDWNPTANEVKEKREETRSKRTAAGRVGARKRWGEDSKSHSKAVANGWQNDGPTPTPTPTPDHDHDHEYEAPRDTRRSVAVAELVEDDSPQNLTLAESDARQEIEATGRAGTAPKKKAQTKVERPAGVTEQTWSDFVAQRKAQKAPVSETALAGIEREADKIGWTLEAALAECVARGWRGFKSDWAINHQRNQQQRHMTRGDEAIATLLRGAEVYNAQFSK